MKTNLFLLVVIIVGGWYLYNMTPPTPEAPTVVVQPREARADYSGTRTFYSSLNDPAVPVGTNYYNNSIYASGNRSSSSLGLNSTSTPVGGSSSYQPSVSLATPRTPSYTSANGDPTLNIKQRASSIGDAAKGDNP